MPRQNAPLPHIHVLNIRARDHVLRIESPAATPAAGREYRMADHVNRLAIPRDIDAMRIPCMLKLCCERDCSCDSDSDSGCGSDPSAAGGVGVGVGVGSMSTPAA